MAARLAGLVKSWFPESDYGFIEAEEVEYFCHASHLQNCYALAPSDKVRFTPESSKKRIGGKKEASQVYLMQRGTTTKASSVRPAATLESATVLLGKSSDNVDTIASRAMRPPWCKVSLPLPAEEKPFQPQPDSDDETGQSPANSFAASSSSAVSSTLSVGDEAELPQPLETPSSVEEGEVDDKISSREAHRADDTPSASAVPSHDDMEVEELALAETPVPDAEIEKEEVEVTAQQVEEVIAQQVEEVGAQQAGEVVAQQVEEVPVEEAVEEVAAQQVEEVTAQQVEEAVEEKPQKHFLGYTAPRCWPGRKREEKTEKKEQETSKPSQPPVQQAAPAKPVVAVRATGTGAERATTKSAPETSAPAAPQVGKASSGASEVVRRAGIVTRWHAASNYGFINDGRCEYFCHASQLKNCVTLASSDQVRFTGVPSEKRPGKKEAREVYLIERGTATSAARPQRERGS